MKTATPLNRARFRATRSRRFVRCHRAGSGGCRKASYRTYDVEIEFNADAAPLVLETVWHATQQVKKKYADGRIVLTFRVDGLDEIVHWVLGWSGRAKVIRPVELREMVVEHLRAAVELNRG